MNNLAPKHPDQSPLNAAIGLLWWLVYAVFIGVMFSATIDRERFGGTLILSGIAFFGFTLGIIVVGVFLKPKSPLYALPGKGRPILHRLQLPSPWDQRTRVRGLAERGSARSRLLRVWWYALFTVLMVAGPLWALVADWMPTFFTVEFRLWTCWLIVFTFALAASFRLMRPARASE